MDVIIKVKGMSCHHCEKTIKEAVQAFENVNHVEVELDLGKVKIDYNQENLSLEDICEAIEAQGYEVDR